MNENDVKIVRVTNIAPFDFTGEIGARYAGRDFPILAGKSLLVPMTVGDHLATHLARQILIQKAPIRDEKQIDGKGSDRPLWDDAVITALKKKIMVDVYEETKPPAITEAERMVQRVAELNKSEGGNVSAGNITPTESAVGEITYKDKADVIEELNKRSIKFNPRDSKDTLASLLQ